MGASSECFLRSLVVETVRLTRSFFSVPVNDSAHALSSHTGASQGARDAEIFGDLVGGVGGEFNRSIQH